MDGLERFGLYLHSFILMKRNEIFAESMLEGEWNGEQLIPRDFVIASTSKQVDNDRIGLCDTTHGNGYGYQIWMMQDGSYSFVGMDGLYWR